MLLKHFFARANGVFRRPDSNTADALGRRLSSVRVSETLGARDRPLGSGHDLDGLTRSFRLVPAVLALAAALVASSAAPFALVAQSPRSAAKHATTFRARVANVIDGDTLRVIDASGTESIVRVEGIDCPESGQPFGGVARRFVRAQAFDRDVDVRVVSRDAHHRLIARVSVNGQDLSTQLLRAGLAWHYTEYSHDAALAAAERDARQAKRGLWSESAAMPPWVWRRVARAKTASGAPDVESGPFFANTSSRVFHAASCRNAHCKNCTEKFPTAEAAEAAGYRPAGDCLK